MDKKAKNRFFGAGLSERKEPACKPGSVEDGHSSATHVTTGLKRPTRKRRGPRHGFPIWPCIGWGLPCHATLPCARCALTAPFQPYRPANRRRRYVFYGTGRRLTPPRRYLAPCPAMPGLSSMPKRHSDRPADSLRCSLHERHRGFKGTVRGHCLPKASNVMERLCNTDRRFHAPRKAVAPKNPPGCAPSRPDGSTRAYRSL